MARYLSAVALLLSLPLFGLQSVAGQGGGRAQLRKLDRIEERRALDISFLEISPDGRWLVYEPWEDIRGVHNAKGSTILYGLKKHKEVDVLIPETIEFAAAARFSPDSQTLAIEQHCKGIVLWPLDRRKKPRL